MQHLNYCRQLIEHIQRKDVLIFEAARGEGIDEHVGLSLNNIPNAVKFSLPEDGVVIDDRSFRALKSIEKINLPYKNFVLEYRNTKNEDGASKDVILVLDADDGGAADLDAIVVILWSFRPEHGKWSLFPAFVFKKDTERTFDAGEGFVNIAHSSAFDRALADPESKETTEAVSWQVVKVVLSFLNALACKNVHIEKSPAKATKQGKKVKAALPFDDYHFLTVDVPGKAGVRGEGLGGSHRSPREHLRRGHIRRLDSGPIWVNACVVNAGIGSKVGKSYLLRKSE